MSLLEIRYILATSHPAESRIQGFWLALTFGLLMNHFWLANLNPSPPVFFVFLVFWGFSRPCARPPRETRGKFDAQCRMPLSPSSPVLTRHVTRLDPALPSSLKLLLVEENSRGSRSRLALFALSHTRGIPRCSLLPYMWPLCRMLNY